MPLSRLNSTPHYHIVTLSSSFFTLPDPPTVAADTIHRSQLSQAFDDQFSADTSRNLVPITGANSNPIMGAAASATGSSFISPEPMNSPSLGRGGEPSEQQAVSTVRRPRGKPPGSRKKPKPVVFVRDDETLKLVVLEIAAGSDVMESVINFGRRRQGGISMYSAYGTISNVTLLQPNPHPTTCTIYGPLSLLSLSATYVSGASCSSPDPPGTHSTFRVCVSNAENHVFGGVVVGKLIAASVVVVEATTFRQAPAIFRVIQNMETERNN